MISVDPGTRWCGVAEWKDAELIWAGLVSTDDLPSRWVIVDDPIVVIEKPQVYQDMKVDPDDLVNLAIVVGRVIGPEKRNVTIYKPSQWKGQLDKKITTARTLASLSKEEISRIVLPRAVKTLGHNVYDAIGIGLAYLRKTGQRVGKLKAVQR